MSLIYNSSVLLKSFFHNIGTTSAVGNLQGKSRLIPRNAVVNPTFWLKYSFCPLFTFVIYYTFDILSIYLSGNPAALIPI